MGTLGVADGEHAPEGLALGVPARGEPEVGQKPVLVEQGLELGRLTQLSGVAVVLDALPVGA